MRIFTAAARGAFLRHTLLPALLAALVFAPSAAQDSPVRFVVPYPPGDAGVFAAFVQAERDRWLPVARDLGLKAQ